MHKTASKSNSKRETRQRDSQNNSGHACYRCGTSAATAVATTAHNDESAFDPIQSNSIWPGATSAAAQQTTANPNHSTRMKCTPNLFMPSQLCTQSIRR
jgi:hypothetical protein